MKAPPVVDFAMLDQPQHVADAIRGNLNSL
jgi:hypothetical protein